MCWINFFQFYFPITLTFYCNYGPLLIKERGYKYMYIRLRILASYELKIRPPCYILPDNFKTRASFKNLNVAFLTDFEKMVY